MSKWLQRIWVVVMMGGISALILFYFWPHIAEWWGDIAYVQLTPCNATDNSIVPEGATGKGCYLIEDLVNLEKALHISEAIALLTALVAIVALILPFFAFLTIKLERGSIDKEVNDKFAELTESMSKNMDSRFDELKESMGKGMDGRFDELKESMSRDMDDRFHDSVGKELSRLNAYRNLSSLANLVADAFSISLINKSDLDHLKTVKAVREKIKDMINQSAEVDQVRSALTNLLEESPGNFVEGLNLLSSSTDTSSSGDFIVALKKYLQEIYKAGYVDNRVKKEKFEKFLKEKFNRRIDVFVSEQAS